MKLMNTLVGMAGMLLACSSNAQMAAADVPLYKASVTSRTVKAVNYQHRSGATRIDFRGTSLLPQATGEAKVESKQGYIEIEVEFRNLRPATANGAEYLTYVMWAITPEGRTSNLGEVLLNGTKSKLNVTTELQVFGLVVTAEPYFAVTKPSDLIVLENVVRAETKGKVEEIDAKYELLQRGEYQRLSNPLALKMDRKIPLELYEARNAVQIARAEGADRFSAETFQKAEKSLAVAEAYQDRRAGEKPVIMTAREAVQTSEDSRAIAVKRQEDEALTAERDRSADRERQADDAKTAAQNEAIRVAREAAADRITAQSEKDRVARENSEQTANALAEADRLKQENIAKNASSQAEADRLKQENTAQAASSQAEADRLKQENTAQAAASQAEADRLKQENSAQAAASQAEADHLRQENSARAASSQAEADRLKQENAAQKDALQAQLNDAAKQKAQLQAEKGELRTQLLAQFNAILQTRDTARGLIVNMSDVLFDTGKYSLRPQAREKLAKVAGIVSGHPGLRLDVEGYTDSVGGDDYNQRLSEQRGGAVRDYLTQEGMAGGSVTSRGFGKSQPVASNDTASGRQQNRRVELVISGDVIGTEMGIPVAAR